MYYLKLSQLDRGYHSAHLGVSPPPETLWSLKVNSLTCTTLWLGLNQ